MENIIGCIEVKGLWGAYDVSWELDPSVNILLGKNGSGKSTILSVLRKALASELPGNRIESDVIDSIIVTMADGRVIEKVATGQVGHHRECGDDFGDKGSGSVTYDYISNFDMTIQNRELVAKLSDNRVRTQLDFELYLLINEYIRYQLRLGKEVEKLFFSADEIDLKLERDKIYGKKELFVQGINRLFQQTGKTIGVDENEKIVFHLGERLVSPYLLSSGEKQILIILLKVLIQHNKPFVFLMDEPEISLHLAWQEELIDIIMTLNDRVQVVVASHSPAIIMKGWFDKVTEIEEIVKAR